MLLREPVSMSGKLSFPPSSNPSCDVYLLVLQKSRQISELQAAVEEYSSITEVSELNQQLHFVILYLRL